MRLTGAKLAMLAGMEGFETFLFNTSVLYNLLVVYAFVQALVLILMLCSFIQRWYVPTPVPNLPFAGLVEHVGLHAHMLCDSTHAVCQQPSYDCSGCHKAAALLSPGSFQTATKCCM